MRMLIYNSNILHVTNNVDCIAILYLFIKSVSSIVSVISVVSKSSNSSTLVTISV